MDGNIRILIAEHDPVDLELLQYELKKGDLSYIPRVVGNESDYTVALVDFDPDIILADYTFPSFDGPTAFALRQRFAADTPFIFVSGTIGEERSIELIKNGVTDYCLKGNLSPLNHKVTRALKEYADNRQKKIVENQLLLSENRLARAQHVAHIGNWEFNFSTKDFFCSEEVFRIYGITRHYGRSKIQSFLSFVHQEDRQNIINSMREIGAGPADMSTTFRIVQNNGFIRHVYVESKFEYNLQGVAIGLHGIIHDITQNVLLENKLAEERMSRLKEITNAVLSAQETERAEIEKELHDNINQILGATKLFLELAKHDVDKREILLNKAIGFVRDAIEQIRLISKKIIIPNKRFIGLFDSIKCLTTDLSMAGAISIRFEIRDIKESMLDEKLQLNIYRIIQEQLNNILKHAAATIVSVILTRENNAIVLFITDNGRGCDLTKKRNGVGIRNIMSRATLCLGKIEIASKPGEGFQLKLMFQLNGMSLAHDHLN